MEGSLFDGVLYIIDVNVLSPFPSPSPYHPVYFSLYILDWEGVRVFSDDAVVWLSDRVQ